MLGDKLTELLEERDMRIPDLSRLKGISVQSLYSILRRNSTRMDVDTLILVCHALNVPVEVFGSDESIRKLDARTEALSKSQ